MALAQALAADPAAVLEATPTATPSATPTNTVTSTATATSTATSTATPIATPTSTATATPSPTMGPTDTPAPPTATPLPTDTPTPTATPTPAVNWRVVYTHQLTPCENRGGHTLFINVVDAGGNGVAGVPLLVTWDTGTLVIYTGEKLDRGPGWAEFTLNGAYTVTVYDGTVSEWTPRLDSHLPESQRCDETNDNVANSFGHYSFEVTFQRAY